MDKNKKYAFVHIAYQNGVGFIQNLISFFNSDFDDSVHRRNLWITRSKDTYEQYKDSCDIILTDLSEVKMINKYGPLGNYIIIHGLHSSGFSLLAIKPKLIKRIIWRTWGHDIILPTRHPKNPIKTILRYSSFWIYRAITKKFALVGTANIVDELKILNVYGNNTRVLRMPYCKSVTEQKEKFKMLQYAKAIDDDTIRVMIGHSGFPIDKHIEIIDSVVPFIDDKVMFYIMLPYGDDEYIKKVIEHARNKLGAKCTVFRNKKPYDEYASFIKSMDIAILGMENSAALGNIALLLYYRKKIYLNPAGDIAKGLDYCGIPYGDFRCIDKEPYIDFIDQYDYDSSCIKNFIPSYFDSYYNKTQWDKIISYLNVKL